MAEVRIVSSKTIYSPEFSRVGQQDTLVTYTIDNGATARTVIVRGTGLSKSDLEAAIRKDVAEKALHAGHTFIV